ncbi:unnamed protein product [Closterium sp. Naga37s-1]|nr:unnamed protein product [Closterium sp. Naga37s-1]
MKAFLSITRSSPPFFPFPCLFSLSPRCFPLLPLSIFLLVAGAIQSEAKVFTVGGSGLSPWGFGVKKWKPKGVIHAGDTLVFKWTGVPHDVWIMNSLDAYNNCNFGAATKKTGITSAGKYKYKVPASAKGTSILFSCSVPGHCSLDNMKVAVPIHA